MSTFAQSLGGTPLIIGLVVGMYSFANMIGNIIAGAAVDKFGAKILYISMGITSFIVLLYTVVQSGEQLLVVRFMHGFSDGF